MADSHLRVDEKVGPTFDPGSPTTISPSVVSPSTTYTATFGGSSNYDCEGLRDPGSTNRMWNLVLC